jgi:hypothetical protein
MEVQTLRGKKNIYGLPDKCPFCHNSITPNVLFAHVEREVFMYCPNNECKQSFIGYYSQISGNNYWTYTGKTSKGNYVQRSFSDIILGISKDFMTIYNQSYFAEQNGLSEICGVGYRKSIEFLIKDYSILKFPDKEETIKNIFLGKCIEDYVNDDKIKSVAKRAVWLGNDEAHFVRKWEGKNLEDLKKLIELTVRWIEIESLTDSFFLKT